MGVVALGFGFGGALGIAGALYHMLNHSLNKSLMFFGAGNMMRVLRHRRRSRRSAVSVRYFPVQGALWLAGAIAITGAPPFGLFLSEFTIMRAGLRPSFSWAVYVMAILLIVIFIGFMNHFRAMYYQPDGGSAPKGPASARCVAWCAAPMWLRSCAAPRVRPVVAARNLGLPELNCAFLVAGRAMSSGRDSHDRTGEARRRRRPADQGRRSHANGLWLSPGTRPVRAALSCKPRGKARFPRLAMPPARSGSERRGNQPVARMVRARDHRSIRTGVRRPSGTVTARLASRRTSGSATARSFVS